MIFLRLRIIYSEYESWKYTLFLEYIEWGRDKKDQWKEWGKMDHWQEWSKREHYEEWDKRDHWFL